MDVKDQDFLDTLTNRFREIESPKNRKVTSSVIGEFSEKFYERLYGDKTTREIDKGDVGLMEKCPTESPVHLEKVLRITEEKLPIGQLIEAFDNGVVTKGMPAANPGFFGLIPSSGNHIYSMAQHLATITQSIALNNFTNPGACQIEKSVVDWTKGVVGFPEKSRGVFVSGTSMGVVLAANAARDYRFKSCADIDRAVIYMTNQCHFCNSRSVNVAGFRFCHKRAVPVDNDQKMDVKCLQGMIIQDIKDGLIPFMVFGTLGTTNFGVIDPIFEINQIAKKYNLWFHVDGAYGGFFLLNSKVKAECKGIDQVDSITLDCHKGLSAPFGSGILLVRDGLLLKQSMMKDQAEYLPDILEGSHYEPLNYSFEVTRSFRGFPIWFALRYFGTAFMEDHIKEKLLLADYVYNGLKDMPNIVIFKKPDLSLVAFRVCPPGCDSLQESNEATKRLLELISSRNSVFLTPTMVEDVFYIRVCILSFRSHLPEVKTVLTLVRENLDWLTKPSDKLYHGIQAIPTAHEDSVK